MIKATKTCVAFFFGFLFAISGHSAAVPGGIHVVNLPEHASTISYRDREVLVLDNQAFLGVSIRTKPGEQTYWLIMDDGSREKKSFLVEAKKYPEQHIKIANKRMVNPIEEDLVRIRGERKRMDEQYNLQSDNPTNVRPFVKPVNGITSGAYGRRRVFNGEHRRPHSGMDIAAARGTPINAPAPGTVSLTGNFYFNGNTVYLNHGGGLVSMMCHMNEISVQEEDVVDRGDTVGLVGATGRATGPHLHWTVILNGVPVDPETVMSILSDQSGSDQSGSE